MLQLTLSNPLGFPLQLSFMISSNISNISCQSHLKKLFAIILTIQIQMCCHMIKKSRIWINRGGYTNSYLLWLHLPFEHFTLHLLNSFRSSAEETWLTVGHMLRDEKQEKNNNIYVIFTHRCLFDMTNLNIIWWKQGILIEAIKDWNRSIRL